MSVETLSVVERFHELYYGSDRETWKSTTWLGTPVLKCPLDLWMYQEIIFDIRPDLIIETGTFKGGSACFLAGVCDQLSHGSIVSIDLKEYEGRASHPRVTYLIGSSTSRDVIDTVQRLANDMNVVMAILDSNHAKAHVLNELNHYAPLITLGSYLIVEDTNVNGHPVFPGFGPGPMEAVQAFLEGNSEFAPDSSRERLLMTFNPGGYLKRIAVKTPELSSKIFATGFGEVEQILQAPISAPLALHADRADRADTTETTADTQSKTAAAEPSGNGAVDVTGLPLASASSRLPNLYLDLLKKCLTRLLFEDDYSVSSSGSRADWNLERRTEGRDWPANAETMIGLRRLDNLELCIRDVLHNGVEGDLIETGVWRGGATIFMRAVLEAYGDRNRIVWAADSFAGLPSPDPENYPADQGDRHHQYEFLRVSLDEVKSNFQRYGLLDDQVQFLVGWFRDTLPTAPIERLSVLRLDGDMYESTLEALQSLYPKLSQGGYVIVDDYGAIKGCRRAVDDFRSANRIIDPINTVDWTCVYWQHGK